MASAGLFAWRHDDRVVIVDIDGTITKARARTGNRARTQAARARTEAQSRAHAR